jgi:hypothetical protein
MMISRMKTKRKRKNSEENLLHCQSAHVESTKVTKDSLSGKKPVPNCLSYGYSQKKLTHIFLTKFLWKQE